MERCPKEPENQSESGGVPSRALRDRDPVLVSATQPIGCNFKIHERSGPFEVTKGRNLLKGYVAMAQIERNT